MFFLQGTVFYILPENQGFFNRKMPPLWAAF